MPKTKPEYEAILAPLPSGNGNPPQPQPQPTETRNHPQPVDDFPSSHLPQPSGQDWDTQSIIEATKMWSLIVKHQETCYMIGTSLNKLISLHQNNLPSVPKVLYELRNKINQTELPHKLYAPIHRLSIGVALPFDIADDKAPKAEGE